MNDEADKINYTKEMAALGEYLQTRDIPGSTLPYFLATVAMHIAIGAAQDEEQARDIARYMGEFIQEQAEVALENDQHRQ